MFQPLLCEKGLRPGKFVMDTWKPKNKNTQKTYKKYLGVKFCSKPPLFSLYVW